MDAGDELDWSDGELDDGELQGGQLEDGEIMEGVTPAPPYAAPTHMAMQNVESTIERALRDKYNKLSGFLKNWFASCSLPPDRTFENFMMTTIHFAMLCHIYPSKRYEPLDLSVRLICLTANYSRLARSNTPHGMKDYFKNVIGDNQGLQHIVQKTQGHEPYLISMEEISNLITDEQLPERWLDWRARLKDIIAELERRRFRNQVLGQCKPFMRDDEGREVHSSNGESIRRALRLKIDWLPFTIHGGMFWDRIAIFNDGSDCYEYKITEEEPTKVLHPPPLPQLPLFFTGPHGVDIPNEAFVVHHKHHFIDGLFERSDGQKTCGISTSTAFVECGMYLDGVPFGAFGDLNETFNSRSLNDERFTTVAVDCASQSPSVRFIIADSDVHLGNDKHVEMQLFPESCDYFDVRILPVERSRARSEGRLMAHEEEVAYQFPDLKFHARHGRNPKEELYAVEIVAMLKPGQNVKVIKGSPHLGVLSQDGAKQVCDKLRTTRRIHAVVCVSGKLSRGLFEWFRIVIDAGREESEDDPFNTLWMYLSSEGVRDLNELVTNTVTGATVTHGKREFPAVPRHMLKFNHDRRYGILRYGIKPFLPKLTFGTLEEMIATNVLGTTRALQYQVLEHQAFCRQTHEGRWHYVSGPKPELVQFHIILRQRSHARQLPLQGGGLGITVLSSADENKPFKLHGTRVAVPHSAQCDLVMDCSLTATQFKQLCEICHQDEPVAVKLRVSLIDQSFNEGLQSLQECMGYHRKAHHFDLALQLLHDLPRMDHYVHPLALGGKCDTTELCSSQRSLTDEKLKRVVNKLGEGLDSSQHQFFSACTQPLPNGYVNLQGPPGSGKSDVTARVIIALACRKKVLVVTQHNNSVDSILSKVVMHLDKLRADGCLNVELRGLRVCRVHPKSHERKSPELSVFIDQGQLPHVKISQAGDNGSTCHGTTEQEWMFEHYHNMTAEKLALARLVDKYARFASRNSEILDDPSVDGQMAAKRKQKLVGDYVQLYDECESEVNGATASRKNKSLEEFDNVVESLALLLLSEMHIVFANLDQAVRILKNFHPEIVIMDEAGTITLPQAVKPLVASHQPEVLITIGDKLQLGPVLPSALADHNEFAKTLSVPFVEQLEPLAPGQGFALDQNYRNPPSIWEFSRKMYMQEGTEVTSCVDVQGGERGQLLKLIQLVQADNRFLDGVLKDRDLTANQQLWFTVPHHSIQECERRLEIQSSTIQPGKFSVTGSGTMDFIDEPTAEYVNRGTRLAVCQMVHDLISIAQVKPVDILVQSTTAEDAQDLKIQLKEFLVDLIAPSSLPVDVMGVTSAQGGENMVVITHIASCACKNGFMHLPKDKLANVAFTRAKLFHFVVGNIDCLGNKLPQTLPIKAIKWFTLFTEHVRKNNQVVDYNPEALTGSDTPTTGFNEGSGTSNFVQTQQNTRRGRNRLNMAEAGHQSYTKPFGEKRKRFNEKDGDDEKPFKR